MADPHKWGWLIFLVLFLLLLLLIGICIWTCWRCSSPNAIVPWTSIALSCLCVFSFSLFGKKPMYTQGMIENVKLIQQRFPNWQVWIYTAWDVPFSVVETLQSFPHVVIVPVPKEAGSKNMRHRFKAIDDDRVAILVVRDADSRVDERDASCIQQFVESNKLFHIVRDHPAHGFKILGGMWGMKKGALSQTMDSLLKEYDQQHQLNIHYGSDQDFLADSVYPRVIQKAMIHDSFFYFEPETQKTSFLTLRTQQRFIGQAYSEHHVPLYD